MTVLAVDPGKMNGWAYTDPYFPERLITGEDTFEGMAHVLHDSHMWALKGIVYEKYTITQATLHKTRQYDALEMIGVLRWTAMEFKIPFEGQTPTDAKRMATDERLKWIGWYTPGMDHGNDAARHLFLYYVKKGLIDFKLATHAPYFTKGN